MLPSFLLPLSESRDGDHKNGTCRKLTMPQVASHIPLHEWVIVVSRTGAENQSATIEQGDVANALKMRLIA